MATTSKARQAANARYTDKTYSRYVYYIRKDFERTFVKWQKRTNSTRNGFIDTAVKFYIDSLEREDT